MSALPIPAPSVTRYIMVTSHCHYGYVVSDGNYGHSMKLLSSIMALIRAEFPDVTLDDDLFDVFRVSKSSRIEGMWGLMFKLPLGTMHVRYQTVNQLPFSIQ